MRFVFHDKARVISIWAGSKVQLRLWFIAATHADFSCPNDFPECQMLYHLSNRPSVGRVSKSPLDKGWLLSQINGLATPVEKTASTPRAALGLYLKSLYAKPVTPAPKGPTPPDISAMTPWGAEWHTEFERLAITAITLEGAKATILLSGGEKSAQVSCVLEAKLWRVTEIKPLK